MSRALNFSQTRDAPQVFKISVNSNIYIILEDEPILVDCGDKGYLGIIREAVDSLVGCDKIKHVLFTHLHYDHVGACKLFPNARFYASAEEISEYMVDGFDTVLRTDEVNELDKIDLLPFENKKRPKTLAGIKMIRTPGHTVGSACYYYDKQNILFTGDTYFNLGMYGRTDLPTSRPNLLDESIRRIEMYKREIRGLLIAPGHDY